MERKKASDFSPEVLKLFDGYVHGTLSRRGFLDGAAKFSVGALKANGKKYELHMYPDTQHGFHNDTTPRYDDGAAKLAWQRTVDFLNRHLRGG